MKKNHEVL